MNYIADAELARLIAPYEGSELGYEVKIVMERVVKRMEICLYNADSLIRSHKMGATLQNFLILLNHCLNMQPDAFREYLVKIRTSASLKRWATKTRGVEMLGSLTFLNLFLFCSWDKMEIYLYSNELKDRNGQACYGLPLLLEEKNALSEIIHSITAKHINEVCQQLNGSRVVIDWGMLSKIQCMSDDVGDASDRDLVKFLNRHVIALLEYVECLFNYRHSLKFYNFLLDMLGMLDSGALAVEILYTKFHMQQDRISFGELSQLMDDINAIILPKRVQQEYAGGSYVEVATSGERLRVVALYLKNVVDLLQDEKTSRMDVCSTGSKKRSLGLTRSTCGDDQVKYPRLAHGADAGEDDAVSSVNFRS